MQIDPIGFAGGDQNLYRYANNNAPDYGDPFGLSIPTRPGRTEAPEKVQEIWRKLEKLIREASDEWGIAVDESRHPGEFDASITACKLMQLRARLNVLRTYSFRLEELNGRNYDKLIGEIKNDLSRRDKAITARIRELDSIPAQLCGAVLDVTMIRSRLCSLWGEVTAVLSLLDIL